MCIWEITCSRVWTCCFHRVVRHFSQSCVFLRLHGHVIIIIIIVLLFCFQPSSFGWEGQLNCSLCIYVDLRWRESEPKLDFASLDLPQLKTYTENAFGSCIIYCFCLFLVHSWFWNKQSCHHHLVSAAGFRGFPAFVQHHWGWFHCCIHQILTSVHEQGTFVPELSWLSRLSNTNTAFLNVIGRSWSTGEFAYNRLQASAPVGVWRIHSTARLLFLHLFRLVRTKGLLYVLIIVLRYEHKFICLCFRLLQGCSSN